MGRDEATERLADLRARTTIKRGVVQENAKKYRFVGAWHYSTADILAIFKGD